MQCQYNCLCFGTAHLTVAPGLICCSGKLCLVQSKAPVYSKHMHFRVVVLHLGAVQCNAHTCSGTATGVRAST